MSAANLQPNLSQLAGLEVCGRQRCESHIKLYCRVRWAPGGSCREQFSSFPAAWSAASQAAGECCLSAADCSGRLVMHAWQVSPLKDSAVPAPPCSNDGESVGWVLLGSHNLSMAAMGRLIGEELGDGQGDGEGQDQGAGPSRRQGPGLYIKSYELAVLLLPRLEAAYRRSPQFGFSCTPGAGALPPGPQPGAACGCVQR